MLKRTLAVALAFGAIGATNAQAQSVAEFYKGKTIKFLVGYNPGGGYDVYSRVLAKHYDKYIPGNPAIVVQNMPGAGSMRLANFLYNAAPKNGLAMGMISRNMPLRGVIDKKSKNVQFDPLKFNWIGSSSSGANDAYVLWYRRDGGVKTIQEVMKPDGPVLLLGATAAGSSGTDVPRILSDAIGIRIKQIFGYRGSDDLYLAIARNEIKGRAVGLSSVRSTQPEWLTKKTMIPLVQFSRETRHPDLPNVPTARELVKTESGLKLIKLAEGPTQYARPVTAPPNIPADRLKALRAAFMETHKDAKFIAETKKLGIAISPIGGEKVHSLIADIAKAEPEQIAYMKSLFAAAKAAKKKRKKKKKKDKK